MTKMEFSVSQIFIEEIETKIKIFLLVLFFILNFLIILPIFGFGDIINFFVYKLFSFVCHQSDSLSFWINGSKLAVCSRCTGIYQAFFISSVLFYFKNIKFQKTYFIKILVISIIVFIFTKIAPFFANLSLLNLLRWLSGVLIGIIFSYSIYGNGGKSGK